MDIGNSSSLFLHQIMCLLAIYKSGEVRKTDVTVAKNYLRENELKELNRIVNMWLDFAEDQALCRKQVFLQDWDTQLDQFLSFNDRNVLQGAGGISKKSADEKAKVAFDIFVQKHRQLKEAERARMNIAALKGLLKIGK